MPLQLFVVALDAALYPTLLAVVALLLSRPRRRPLLTAYLAGGLTISIAIGVALVALLHGSGALDGDRPGLSWISDLAIGGLAVLLAVALATRADTRLKTRRWGGSRRREEHEPLIERVMAQGSVPIAVLVTVVINLPGAAYLVGLRDIAAGDHGAGTVLLLIVAFNIIMFALAEIPLVGLVVAPDRTVAAVHRLDAWAAANRRWIAAALSLALGVFLVVRGVAKAS
jgi:hypothetical protein